MNRLRRGFTLVELIVVIAVIGIIASIAIIGFGRFQADGRDAKRLSSVTVISEALEKYYDENGEYPGCQALNTNVDTVVSDTLKGVAKESLVAPQAPSGETNSIGCTGGTGLSLTSDDYFEYYGDNSPACTSNIACLSYTLKYKSESEGAIKAVSSRRNTSIASAGAPTLISTSVDFSTVGLSWTQNADASAYQIDTSTTAGFNAGTFTSVSQTSGTTRTITGLNPGTSYWFRVRAQATSSSTNYSNYISVSTLSIPTPTGCNTVTSANQITASCNTIANATTYEVRYSTSSSMSPVTATYPGLATPSRTVTGLTVGTTYYFQVRGSDPEFTGAWSSVFNGTTTVPPPSCTSTALNSNTQMTSSWGAVANATSYTYEYSTNSGFSGAATTTGITGTSRTSAGLANATTYYSRVKTLIGSVDSVFANCPTVTTGINGPTGVGWYAQAEAVRARAGLPWMPGQDPGYGSTFWTNGMVIYGSCNAGATVVTRLYSYYATSSNGSPNDASLLDWTWGNSERYVVNGTGSWHVWWQGWVACQTGSTRVGDTYLGNAGPY